MSPGHDERSQVRAGRFPLLGLLEVHGCAGENSHARREARLGGREATPDLDTRKGRMKAGDVLETEVETLRGFGEPPPPYRAVVSIPGGFEYTGEGNSAAPINAAMIASDRAGYDHLKITPDWTSLRSISSRSSEASCGVAFSSFMAIPNSTTEECISK